MISYEGVKILENFLLFKRNIKYFNCACAETELPVKDVTLSFAPVTSISYKTGIFPLTMTFAANSRCFCAQFSHDFEILTFDVLTLAVSRALSFICRTQITNLGIRS